MWFSVLHTLYVLNDNNQSHGLKSDTTCIKEISNFAFYILVGDYEKFMHFLTNSKLDNELQKANRTA